MNNYISSSIFYSIDIATTPNVNIIALLTVLLVKKTAESI